MSRALSIRLYQNTPPSVQLLFSDRLRHPESSYVQASRRAPNYKTTPQPDGACRKQSLSRTLALVRRNFEMYGFAAFYLRFTWNIAFSTLIPINFSIAPACFHWRFAATRFSNTRFSRKPRCNNYQQIATVRAIVCVLPLYGRALNGALSFNLRLWFSDEKMLADNVCPLPIRRRFGWSERLVRFRHYKRSSSPRLAINRLKDDLLPGATARTGRRPSAALFADVLQCADNKNWVRVFLQATCYYPMGIGC